MSNTGFEGGSLGDPVTTTSEPTLQQVVTAGGTTITYDTAHIKDGTFAAKCTHSGGNHMFVQRAFDEADGSTTYEDGYFRFYFYLSGTPAAALALFTFGTLTADQGHGRINTTGKFSLYSPSGTTLWVTTNVIPIGQWVRVEGHLNTSATPSIQVRLFYGANVDGDTADESAAKTHTSLSTGGDATLIAAGHVGTQAVGIDLWLDNFASSTTDWLGPYVAGPASTVPDPPTSVTAVAGNADAIVAWDAPENNGGATITGYTVTSSPGGITASVDGVTLTAEVDGLTNGTAYTFTVVATNSVGDSDPSAASSAVTPTAPAASVAFVQETSDTTANGPSTDVVLPADTANGNLLLFFATLCGAKTVTQPTGITPIADTNTGTVSSDTHLMISSRIAASDGSVDWEWTGPNTGVWAPWALAALEYEGISTSTPLDVAAIVQRTSNGSMPSITTVHAGCVLVYGVVTNGTLDVSTPDGWTQRVDIEASTDFSVPHLVIFEKIQSAAGASTPIPATLSATNDNTIGFLLALRPAVLVNRAPVAKAGVDQVVATGAVFTLDGSASSDPDGDTITYAWEQLSGTNTVVLSSDTAESPTGTAPSEADTLVYGLTVNDGDLDSTQDTVSITVVAAPDPVTGLTTDPGQTSITLNWTPSDSDVDHVEVRRALGSVAPATIEDGTFVVDLIDTVATYTDTELVAGETYSYSLFAVNSLGLESSVTSVTDTTTPDTPQWTLLIGEFTAPSGTASIKLKMTFKDASAASDHWIDNVGLFIGSQTTWSRGGIADNGTVLVEGSDDAGITWQNLRVGAAPVPAGEVVQLVDGDVKPQRIYRATISTTVNDLIVSSEPAVSDPVVFEIPHFTISDPVQNDGMDLEDVQNWQSANTENVAWYEPLGRSRALKLSTGLVGDKYNMEVEFFSDDDFAKFKDLRARQAVLLIRTPFSDDQVYVKFNEVFSWVYNPGAKDITVTCGFTQVDWKA